MRSSFLSDKLSKSKGYKKEELWNAFLVPVLQLSTFIYKK